MNAFFYADLESRSKRISARSVNIMFTCLLGPLKYLQILVLCL